LDLSTIEFLNIISGVATTASAPPTREAREATEPRETREAVETRETREIRETEEATETPETREAVETRETREAESPADEIWSLLRMFFGHHKRRFLIAASALDLHPAQAGALLHLHTPLPMNELANLLGCDSSNVTGIVDRLETRGLVVRQPSPSDRRVRNIVLTADGQLQRDQLLAQLGGPPPGLERLSRAEQYQLRDLLARALSQ
jgi:DNA-binding MarR family transcriptional regulator